MVTGLRKIPQIILRKIVAFSTFVSSLTELIQSNVQMLRILIIMYSRVPNISVGQNKSVGGKMLGNSIKV